MNELVAGNTYCNTSLQSSVIGWRKVIRWYAILRFCENSQADRRAGGRADKQAYNFTFGCARRLHIDTFVCRILRACALVCVLACTSIGTHECVNTCVYICYIRLSVLVVLVVSYAHVIHCMFTVICISLIMCISCVSSVLVCLNPCAFIWQWLSGHLRARVGVCMRLLCCAQGTSCRTLRSARVRARV